VTQKGVGPEVRSRVVTKLVEAIDEAERLAKESGKRSRSGAGGSSPKERWYLVMAYLAQVLDGVLKKLRPGERQGEDGPDGSGVG
jgi:hypothetical protein